MAYIHACGYISDAWHVPAYSRSASMSMIHFLLIFASLEPQYSSQLSQSFCSFSPFQLAASRGPSSDMYYPNCSRHVHYPLNPSLAHSCCHQHAYYCSLPMTCLHANSHPAPFAQTQQYQYQQFAHQQQLLPDILPTRANHPPPLFTDPSVSPQSLELPETAQYTWSESLTSPVGSPLQSFNNILGNDTTEQRPAGGINSQLLEGSQLEQQPTPNLPPDLLTMNGFLSDTANSITDDLELSAEDEPEYPLAPHESSPPRQDDSDDVPEDLFRMGFRDENGEWRCKFEGCISPRIFTRACDLRKHWYRHRKDYKCSHRGCSMRFATAKDMRRHLASHDPGIQCAAVGCTRTFSRIGVLRTP